MRVPSRAGYTLVAKNAFMKLPSKESDCNAYLYKTTSISNMKRSKITLNSRSLELTDEKMKGAATMIRNTAIDTFSAKNPDIAN